MQSNNRLLAEVKDELLKARIAHEPMHNAHEAHSVILEELDEYWELVKLNPNKLGSDERREDRLHCMRKELIQIAAMAIRAIQDTLPEVTD